MTSKRLFVGGIAIGIDDDVLKKCFSDFGTVSDVNIKEKKDPEGNILSKFAFVNLEAPDHKVQECVQTLNGTRWKGSTLRIEVAKESFIQKLQRERQHLQEKWNTDQYKEQNWITENKHEITWKRKQEIFPRGNYTNNENKQNELSCPDKKKIEADYIKALTNFPDMLSSKKKNTSSSSESDSDSEIKEGIPKFLGTKKLDFDKKTKEDEKISEAALKVAAQVGQQTEKSMLTSFKNYSSVWGDSDEDDNDAPIKKKKKMRQESFPREELFPLEEKDAERSCDSKPGNAFQMENIDLEKEKVYEREIVKSVLPSHSKLVTKFGMQPVQPVTRYDPTRPEHEQYILNYKRTGEDDILNSSSKGKDLNSEQTGLNSVLNEQTPERKEYVQIVKSLDFKKNDKFSLLKQFSDKRHEEGIESENEDDVIVHHKDIDEYVPKPKSRDFFVSPDDPLINEGTIWMVQSLTEDVIKEFQDDRLELVELYNTKVARNLQKQKSSTSSRGRGRGRGRGRDWSI